MEMQALASYYLLKQLGDTFDLDDFLEAWDYGCKVEKAVRARKAELAGTDKKNIQPTVNQVTLKTEVRVMHNNARSGLISKIIVAYREVNNLGEKPKGVQNQKGQKAVKIDDDKWDLHCKELLRACPSVVAPNFGQSGQPVSSILLVCLALRSTIQPPFPSALPPHPTPPSLPFLPPVASVQKTSRYGAPWSEGEFHADKDKDKSTDPVGKASAVQVLARVFNDQIYSEEEVLEKAATDQRLEFTVLQVAVVWAVVRQSAFPSPACGSPLALPAFWWASAYHCRRSCGVLQQQANSQQSDACLYPTAQLPQMTDKMKAIHRGATCSDGSFDNQVRCERRRQRPGWSLLHHHATPSPVHPCT